jgi:predicted ATPase/DNA-binding SARP family transcriptional activator
MDTVPDSETTYRQHMKFCGKASCRKCREGIGHGPYWFSYQSQGGKTVQHYIGKHLPPGIQVPPPTDQASVRLLTLGQERLEYRTRSADGQWFPVKDSRWNPQLRSLVGGLICSPGRGLSLQQIATLLWPGRPIEPLLGELRRILRTLDQLLNPLQRHAPLVHLAPLHVRLAEQTHLWIDADAFEGCISQARGAPDSADKESLLEEAVRLYGGEFWPYERQAEWAQRRRDTLHRGWIGAVLELADLRIQHGRLHESIDILDRLLSTAPSYEPAIQRLMLALARLGRRGEALLLYQRFLTESGRAQEAVVSPSPEIVRLYEAILHANSLAEWTLQEDAASWPLQDRRVSARSAAIAIGRANQRPLIGREPEQALLRAHLLAVEQGPEGRSPGSASLFLMGDAGIGKTRLAEEMAREAHRHGWRVLWTGSYAQESTIPYHIWSELLRQVTRSYHRLDQVIQSAPLLYQPLGVLLTEREDLFPRLEPPTIPSPEQEQLRLWEAVCALFIAVSESGAPLLIVLDDLQWADNSSVEMLAYLVRHLRGHPILVAGTCRDSNLPERHALRALLRDLQREQAAVTMTVLPLTDEQVGTLVTGLPEQAVRSIQARAAGNPFFAEELARTIGPQGRAAERFANASIALPDTIAAVLDLRLERISSACRRLLSRAAVLGGSFEYRFLRAMESGSDISPEDTTLDLLDEALRAGLLMEDGSGAHITYHFWHPLLADHLYDNLSAGRRARLHRRASDLLQAAYAGREQEHAAAIVNHLASGGADSPTIARYAKLAGDRAYALSAYTDAHQYYRLALEHITAHAYGHAEGAYLLERQGECAIILGRYQEAQEAYEQLLARPADTASGDPQLAERRAMICSEIGWTWRYRGDIQMALRYCDQGEELLRSAGVIGGPAWASLSYQRSSLFWQEGRYNEAGRAAQEALALFENALARQDTGFALPAPTTRLERTLAGDPVDLGRIHSLLAALAASTGQSGEAASHYQAALSIFEQEDRQREIASVLCNQGDLFLRLADHEAAQSALRRALHLAERMGDRATYCVVSGNMGMLARRRGDLAEAVSWFERAVDLAESLEDPVYVSLWQAYLAGVLHELGDTQRASAMLRRALVAGRSIPACLGIALTTLGWMRLSQAQCMRTAGFRQSQEAQGASQPADVTQLLASAKRAILRALTNEVEAETRLEGQLALAEMAWLEGDYPSAQSGAQAIIEQTTQHELRALLARATELLGSLLAARGDPEQAANHFEQAIRLYHASGMRLERAHALQSYGMALLTVTEPAAAARKPAVRLLNEALHLYEESQAHPAWRAIEQLLAAEQRQQEDGLLEPG